MRKAVVLLSGGLDSMVAAGLAREQGYSVLALTVDYGQRHSVELESAKRIAAQLAGEHVVLDLDLRRFGGSALTADHHVPNYGVVDKIPNT
jgi:7-cyano-7-deazaguanine synthase